MRDGLSLHHLCALELSAAELVTLAARLQCSHVGVFTCLPPRSPAAFPVIESARDVQAVKRRLSDEGISVNNVEVFALDGGLDAAHYEAALARGAALGARVATVHLHGTLDLRAVEVFSRFCDLAADHGMRAALEFTSFSAVRNLRQALWVLDSSDHDNAAVAIDSLHFFRNEGQPDDLIGVCADEVAYLQLCDGPLMPPPDLYAEAVAERLIPGAGEFPLQELLASAPAPLMFDVGVPQRRRQHDGEGAFERAAEAVAAARRLLAGRDPASRDYY